MNRDKIRAFIYIKNYASILSISMLLNYINPDGYIMPEYIVIIVSAIFSIFLTYWETKILYWLKGENKEQDLC